MAPETSFCPRGGGIFLSDISPQLPDAKEESTTCLKAMWEAGRATKWKHLLLSAGDNPKHTYCYLQNVMKSAIPLAKMHSGTFKKKEKKEKRN